ncbi:MULTISPECIES: protein translocase subunit SecD [Thauera]|jgi:preprotein translocase subunit SecD|uniref:Protein translocase subunit SecD n=2 Tax=Thauera aminoaromatica TaxID=164330 RepID=N6YUK0_THASP|nr:MULTISPECIES: protein translocase subunit SecD [Thauera]MBL8461406.1 protein translocase subunit SecD [Thauera sp.]ENO85818.1 preprotein translocase subunit SecD [Thauera aminoaromatica S2]KIN91022.1 export membrane protein SecD [Thauera sp. SWB20]TXH81485.1 MAG: protein translocase subunit SecD [Thauera aminoaromatica]HNV89618.1 protein translocase subunit SecD [Thauera aminoaromatica]
MNRYPLWKNLLIGLVLLWGLIYTLPNFYGEVPAVQVSSAKATLKLDTAATTDRIAGALKAAGIENTGIFSDATSVRARFKDTETQLRAKDVIEQTFNPDAADPSYVVALNLLSASPSWLTSIQALPMYLGLDLRGGVHFLLEVDMPGALVKRLDSTTGDLRTLMRDKSVRHAGITREGNTVVIRFRDAAQREAGRRAILDSTTDLQLVERDDAADDLKLVATLTPQAQQTMRDFAIKQNITTLHNRINELGVAEPVIQQQGAERIVVQLPGVQDVAKAKDILGRTATLEVRMVDDTPGAIEQALAGSVPFGTELYNERGGSPLLVKKQVVLTGDRLTDAQPGFDGQTNEPAVHLTLDAAGARIFRDVTRESVGKRMAILLFEKGKGEVVTAPVIRSEIGGGRVQISGRMSTVEANDVALLLRAGSLAAPMEIIEERTVGPSLGAENIAKGFNSTLWGFLAIVVFMCGYYLLVGLVSSIALAANLLLLVALLSLLQATLTLPGIAAMALTLGMAIDSNVLINERIREELRNGASPQAAIAAGYDRAWDTILDSNITTLIAGIALLVFGSGPVRGFAVVHCLGILTSMFSAILVSRMLINFIYGRRRKVESLSIGQVWKPDTK